MNPAAVISDWKHGLKVWQIGERYSLSKEVSYACLYCSAGLDPHEISERLSNVRPGMSAARIKVAMSYRWSTKNWFRISLKQFYMAKRLRSFRIFLVATRSFWQCARTLFYHSAVMKVCLVALVFSGAIA